MRRRLAPGPQRPSSLLCPYRPQPRPRLASAELRLSHPFTEDLRQNPTAATSASLPLSPAIHVAAPRQPKGSSATHAPGSRARPKRLPHPLPCFSRQQVTQSPCVSRTANHAVAPRQPNRKPRSRPASAEPQTMQPPRVSRNPIHANAPSESGCPHVSGPNRKKWETLHRSPQRSPVLAR